MESRVRSGGTGIGAEFGDGIVAAARTGIGDALRSVLYFTPSAFDVLYVRSDLYDSESAAREAKTPLVEFETAGFAEAPVRNAVAAAEPAVGVGPYEFTVRFHRDGFVVRLIEGDHGVLVTTESMNVGGFEEAATAIRRLLAGA
jgi:hypothetical protein